MSVSDVALPGVAEGLLKCLNHARVESVDLRLKRSKLKAGDKEAGKMPPIEIRGFQANQKTVQAVAPGRLLGTTKRRLASVPSSRRGQHAFSAIATSMPRRRYLSIGTPFCQVWDGPGRRRLNSLAL